MEHVIDSTKLKELMSDGIVEFSYEKLNGDLRDASGTLNAAYIQDHNGTPKGTSQYDIPEDTLRYFDTVSNGWRTCKIDRIFRCDAMGFHK